MMNLRFLFESIMEACAISPYNSYLSLEGYKNGCKSLISHFESVGDENNCGLFKKLYYTLDMISINGSPYLDWFVNGNAGAGYSYRMFKRFYNKHYKSFQKYMNKPEIIWQNNE